MRITLDTNILVSAFLAKSGLCDDILQLIPIMDIELVLSEDILDEFVDVVRREEVRRRFDYTDKDIKSFAKRLKDVSEIIDVKSRFRVIKDDPDDNIMLNCAYDGKVDYLISNDRHMRDLREFKKVKILSPKEFIDIVKREFEGDDVLMLLAS